MFVYLTGLPRNSFFGNQGALTIRGHPHQCRPHPQQGLLARSWLRFWIRSIHEDRMENQVFGFNKPAPRPNMYFFNISNSSYVPTIGSGYVPEEK